LQIDISDDGYLPHDITEHGTGNNSFSLNNYRENKCSHEGKYHRNNK
jgi:hypothetical protein